MIRAGAPLDGLPTKNGFRMRGLEMTRIETFTDAAFAFAVTLLVVSIDQIPSTVPLALPGWVYMGLAVVMPAHGIRVRRRRARLVAAAGDAT